MRSRRRRLWSWMLQIIISVAVISAVTALPEEIKIGGLFETTEHQQELAFGYAIDGINSDIGILPRSKLSAQVKKVAPQDSFRALKAACDFLEEGVAAIIAPPSPSTIGVLQSTCDSFHVPLIQTHWDYRTQLRNLSLNLFPHPSVLAQAFLDVIKGRHWKSFTLIYEDNEALIRLQELVKAPSTTDQKIKVTLRQVDPEEEFKKLMKDLKISRENNFIVDLSLKRVMQLFEDAAQVDMFTDYQNYFLTSLDIHTVNWSPGLGSKSNVTALRLVDPENQWASRVIRDWKFAEERQGRDDYSQGGFLPHYHPIQTEAALLYDAVTIVAQALEELDRGQSIYLRSLSCDLSVQWSHGSSLVNYMKMKPRRGVSGDINFDKRGQRTNFAVDIVKLKKDRIEKEGTWDPQKKIVFTESTKTIAEDTSELFKGKNFIVTTVLKPPYMSERKNKEDFQGNDRYKGYCKDLLDKIAAKLKFNYTIMPEKDNKPGNLQPNGEWNGMIGLLLKREVDLAIGDLTITYEREEYVDFTMPFMNLGISILFKKQEKKNPPLFSFLEPLSLEVWFYMATAFLGVSMLMFLLARLSPYEWVNPHPCDPENDVVENQFNLLNSFWFAIGSIMQQGSDLLPRAISTRIVASSWWFFTLIMISSYTANLAAFLTAQRMTAPITNANDLAKQTKIKYGCYDSGSTKKFFQGSAYPTYKRMWSFMESDKAVFTKTNDDGIKRVARGDYAFLMESSSIEYETAKNCDLVKIGGELDAKGYGIATQPGSPYRNGISTEILYLQEHGQLHELKEMWWKKSACSDDSGGNSAEMGIGQVGGVFLVLCIGMGLGLIVVVLEFIWKAKKQIKREPIPIMLWQELRFILSCRGSSRPAPKEDDEDEPSMDKFQMLPLKKDDEDAEKYS